MKSSPLDYLLSTLFVVLISAIAILMPWSLSAHLRYVLHGYAPLASVALFMIAYGVVSAVTVRVLLRLKSIPPGSYQMLTSREFIYWKLLTVIYRLGEASLRPFTPVFFRPLLVILFGAKVGRDVAMGGAIDDPYMVEIGSDSVLGHNSLVSANYVRGGDFVCGRVKIGKNVTIGPYAVIFPGCDIGDNVTIAGGSQVMPNTRIPSGENWRGNPARKWL